MFDCHYDLLAYILMKKHDVDFLKKYCAKVYNQNNITGGIFNLFYMNPKEMKEEIGIEKNDIHLIKNLTEVKHFIESNKLFSKDINYIFGIEGLDYLQSIDDIDILYSLGLRSTNIVWNNENKFGGGAKVNNNIGLSSLGKNLVIKLINKNIAIDLSHTNQTTFWDIIDICHYMKKQGKSPIVFASHSNARTLCDVSRNLTDEQIIAIKKLNGVIGVVSIKRFCINTLDVCNPNIDFEQEYLKHINYIRNLLGNTENIAIATDDMKYYDIEPEYYQNANVYLHYDVKDKLENALIRNGYNHFEIEQILENNFKEKILSRL